MQIFVGLIFVGCMPTKISPQRKFLHLWYSHKPYSFWVTHGKDDEEEDEEGEDEEEKEERRRTMSNFHVWFSRTR